MLVHETNTSAMPLHCSKTREGGDRHADLSQPDEEVEDVGVVVDDGTSLDIGGELSLALGVESLIEVIFSLIKSVLAQCDGPTCHQQVLVSSRLLWVSMLFFAFVEFGVHLQALSFPSKATCRQEHIFCLKNAEPMLSDVKLGMATQCLQVC